MDRRASWDEYFMNIARMVATRATCDRKHVGAVLVRDRTLLSTGYNGSIRGLGHCSEEGHMMEDGHCVRTVHAEANAIIQAAKNGVAIDGATIYTTASPCWPPSNGGPCSWATPPPRARSSSWCATPTRRSTRPSDPAEAGSRFTASPRARSAAAIRASVRAAGAR